MADRHFRSLFRALHLRREQWTFLLMALLCVSVIVGTALWTRQAEFARVTPTPPISGDISAAQLLQQSLDSAQTATPAPTVSPTVRSVTTPLESMTLLRPFDNTRMRQSSATGLWALHDAADYAGAEGAKVSAMADGTVISCADSGVFGAYAEIDHGGGSSCAMRTCRCSTRFARAIRFAPGRRLASSGARCRRNVTCQRTCTCGSSSAIRRLTPKKCCKTAFFQTRKKRRTWGVAFSSKSAYNTTG